jgi:hypothetical protein
MKRSYTPILVTLIMIIGILGITNPGFKQPYKLFGDTEGNLTHNYFIFSIYQQYYSSATTGDGKYVVYKRYIGIAMNFFEISSLQEQRK